MRRIAVIVHRCVGLFLALFLTIAGLTGSIIAFNHELDRALNPGVMTVLKPTPNQAPVTDWIAAVTKTYPAMVTTYITVPQTPDEPATLYLEPIPGNEAETKGHVNQIFVHPGTSEILGGRDRDAIGLDRMHIMPFIYTLHYSLHLGGPGVILFGIVALIWFFDCFVGMYLGWPKWNWKAFRQAFSVKFGAGAPRVTYDLHRAGGLWVWVILAILAFTGMSMNLHQQIFEPLLSAVAPQSPSPGEDAPDRADPLAPMPTTIPQAISTASKGLTETGLEGTLGGVWIDPLKGFYHLGFHTPIDIMKEHAGTWVSVNGMDGKLVEVRPAGGKTAGDAIHDWQFPLHSGKAFGLGGRIVIAVIGVVVAMLSVTGVLIWWRKMRGKARTRKHREEGVSGLN